VELRRLGDSGLMVSSVGLGTNNFAGRLDDEAARVVLNEALEQASPSSIPPTSTVMVSKEGPGGSESQLGRLLEGRRARFVVATKFGMSMSESPLERGASRRWIVQAVENSLRRLRTDYIDLYQVHTPDSETPIEETMRSLDDLVRSGKVRYVGHSNFAAWQIVDADWTARSENLARPISAQMHYSLLTAQSGRGDPGLRGPRAGGDPLLPARIWVPDGQVQARRGGPRQIVGERARRRGDDASGLERIAAFERFAGERGHSLLDLAFGWLLSQPIVASVIASASTPEQVRANVAAAEWRLSAADMESFAAL